MEYYMIEGTFREGLTQSRDEIREAIEEHRSYLQKHLEKGNLLFAGPKPERNGGIIILKANNILEALQFCDDDPLKIAGIQEFRIIEFQLDQCQSQIEDWFE